MPNELFSEKDLLQLLQLQTRRIMAEKRTRTGPLLAEDTGIDAGATEAGLPARWRLIPEETELHQWQRECLPLWLSSGRGTIKVATGGGKTLFALAAAQHLQNGNESDLRLAIVVPTIPLMFQWYDELKQSNIPESAIGLMGGGEEPSAPDGIRVLICVLNSARDRLPAFASQAGWPEHMMLVVDECHRANATQASRIFDCRPRYTLGLSATPEQDSGDQGIPSNDAYEASTVGHGLGPIIFEFSLRQSLEAGLLTPFEVWHVGLPLTMTEAAQYERLSSEISELRKALQVTYRRSRSSQDFLAWCQSQISRGGNAAAEAERFIGLANRRKRLLYQAEARSKVALGVLAEANASEHRAIVFHESVAEIDQLFLSASDLGLPVVLEHSQLPSSLRDENIEAFRRGVARVIISAKSLVEGFNVPTADLGIIMASSGSVRQRVQSLGRMLRRKADQRGARIIVLYVRDTEDEAIYEKADWEGVIGAERNRYFQWQPVTDRPWSEGLEEISKAPRAYKPPSSEIDVNGLQPGDPYPGKPDGMYLKVDQSDNLRTEDGAIVAVPQAVVQEILLRNSFRRAHRTWAGHLIVRVDAQGSTEPDWRFLAVVDPPMEEERSSAEKGVRLRIRRVAGRQVLALEEDRLKVRFAQGPVEVLALLLNWVVSVEREKGVLAMHIFWDRGNNYWLEVQGERLQYKDSLPPLEFPP
ncbi:DEAD/DEAH box helicase [Geomonas anaerohicana]|uniref:DEAD/DEAH box helicase n=1 Tax=Geomonas anaerohicana TaxID=2798583 RepID=A0ABS0YC58_9BACT|nr:DEAD/DEAH box helicase [Geomonas anaerohicana]MBJ6749892.1 DEAD/DEAH box helicase [Geomonas anaerohicana]